MPAGSSALPPAPRAAALLRWLDRAAIGLLLVPALLYGAMSLRWPFSWDHGIFAWIAETIVHGGLPYRDAWDVKGPLTFYSFALVRLVTGRGMWGIRLFDLLVLGAGALAAARLVDRLGGPRVGRYAGLFLVLFYGGAGFWDTAQPDGWAAVLLLIAFVPLLSGKPTSPRAACAAGAAAGVAALFKPLFGVFLLVPLLYVLLDGEERAAVRVRRAVLVGLACAVPLALCAAWFAAHGAFWPLFDTYVLYNLEQAGSPAAAAASPGQRFLWRLWVTPVVVPALAAAAAGIGLVLRTDRRAAVLLLLWLGLGFWAVWTQHRFWSLYQWHVALVPLAVAAWVGVGRLWYLRPAGAAALAWRLGALALGALLFARAVRRPLRDEARWLELVRGRLTADQYDAAYATGPLSWSVPQARRVAAYVERHTAPTDRVLVWSDPTVNYLTGRPSVGRLVFHNPFDTDHPTPHREAYRAELLESLEARPPRLVIMARRNLEVSDSINEANVAARFPRLAELLARNFHPVDTIGEMIVHARN
jgi:4-amino-4-deoxy-L-arabinose transferase-like glycosyltransferase